MSKDFHFVPVGGCLTDNSFRQQPCTEKALIMWVAHPEKCKIEVDAYFTSETLCNAKKLAERPASTYASTQAFTELNCVESGGITRMLEMWISILVFWDYCRFEETDIIKQYTRYGNFRWSVWYIWNTILNAQFPQYT